MALRDIPEIRIGLVRFVGREALRSQRWAIAWLVIASGTLKLSLALVLLTLVLQPELLNVLNRANNRVECSGLLCPLLKVPLIGQLMGAGPLHFEEVRPASVHQDNVRNALK